MNFRGFTLVEMMVSIAIFTAITSIAVFNNARFNSSILLTNLAYDVALSIRQAQVYGTTVKQDSGGSFNSAYGVLFPITTAGTAGNFYVFEDLDNNGQCGDDPEYCTEPELLETYTFKNGNRISKILVNGIPSDQVVSVSFKRPNPNSVVYAFTSFFSEISGSRVQICLSSTDNLHRMVTVESTGQIGVSIPTTECN